MATTPERLAKIEEWARGHEQRCEERLAAIHEAVGEVKGSLAWQRNALWAVVAALLAWALAQLWTGNQDRLERLERPAVATADNATIR